MSIEFAKSLSGHDRNQTYLVKEKDERFVYLVNGTTKTLDAPKKKSKKHIQIIRELPEEVTEILIESMTDFTIKRAIKTYNRRNQEKCQKQM
jgi:hypothetical protein